MKKNQANFAPKGNFSRPASVRSKPAATAPQEVLHLQELQFQHLKSSPITNDYEKRKLAEQRATRRLKG